MYLYKHLDSSQHQMLIYEGKSKENLKTFVIDWLIDWMSADRLSHIASCVCWSFHSIASEQSGVVECDCTSLVVSKACVASVRGWVVHEECQKGLCRGGIGKVWRCDQLAAGCTAHLYTQPPPSPLQPTHTSQSAHHLYVPVTNWSDLAILPCHMMYCGILYGPLDPLRCSYMMMASHTHPAMQ